MTAAVLALYRLHVLALRRQLCLSGIEPTTEFAPDTIAGNLSEDARMWLAGERELAGVLVEQQSRRKN